MDAFVGYRCLVIQPLEQLCIGFTWCTCNPVSVMVFSFSCTVNNLDGFECTTQILNSLY